MSNNTPIPLVQDTPKVAKVTIVATTAQDDVVPLLSSTEELQDAE